MGQGVNSLIKDVVMPSPNAASLGKYGDIPVSYSTGVPSIGVPIYALTEGSLSVPISLSYHAGGLKVGEPCSWVGLNWVLQAGGMISRNIRGRADEQLGGYLSSGDSLLKAGRIANGEGEVGYVQPSEIYNATIDGEPDIFSFSFLGHSGKFYIDADKHVEVIPKQDIKINYYLTSGYGGNRLYKFRITTNDGTIYEFGNSVGVSEIGEGIEYSQTTSQNFPIATGWYLRKIYSSDGPHIITFTYEREIFRQMSRTTPIDAPNVTTTSDRGSAQGSYSLVQTDIQSLRLSQIKTLKETITFEAGDERKDIGYGLYKDVTKVARALSAIRIDNGSFCKKFVLTQSYFRDSSAYKCGEEGDYRLRLDKVQEKSCTDVNTSTTPYIFTYQAQQGDTNFLPNRYSAAIDHWGYYNAANTNPANGFNIPFTRLTYPIPTDLQGSNFIIYDVAKGKSNRESNEVAMKLGTIKQIIYPTGGTTNFEFESNTYWDTTGTAQLENEPVLLSRYWDTGQCFQDVTPLITTAIATKTFTTSNYGFIYNVYFTWENKKAYACDNSPSVEIKLFRISDQLLIGTALIASSNSIQSSRLDSLFPAIKLDVAYRFEMKGQNIASRFFTQKQSIVGKNANKIVGGLRIKKITSSDGGNLANDVVKTYDYSDETNVLKTSGILYNKPSYSIIVQGSIGNSIWNIKRVTSLNCNATIAYPINTTPPLTKNQTYITGVPSICIYDRLQLPNSYQFHYFFENSIIPLNSFEGNHIDYKRVKEKIKNGAYTVFTFSTGDEQDKEDFEGYPKLPLQPRLNTGNGVTTTLFNNNNVKVSQDTTSYYPNDVYTQSVGDCYKVARTPSPSLMNTGSWGLGPNYSSFGIPAYIWFVKKYKIRNKAVRTATVKSIIDGIESSTTYSYDSLNRFLAPTVVTTVNSDGKEIKTKHYYTANLPSTHPNSGTPQLTDLVKYYMIGIPLQTEQFINNKKVGGAILEYKDDLPFQAYSLNRDSTKKLAITVEEYINFLPTKIRKANYLYPQVYAWDAYNRVTKKTFGTLNTTIQYYGTSNLPNVFTDENGLRSKFTYDSLMRLSKTQNRFSGTDINNPQDVQAATTYTYHYKGQAVTDPNDVNDMNNNFVRTKSEFKGVTDPLSTKQYLDGLGRPIEGVKEFYTPKSPNHPNDYWHQKNYIAYDTLGRQSRSYLPFETGTLGFEAQSILLNAAGYVETRYEESPLSRPISQRNPDGTFTYMSYGANIAADAVQVFTITGGANALISATSSTTYAPNTLYKTTSTDENGKKACVFKDKLGRVILTRKLLNGASGDNVDTYNVYDDYGQLVAVLPPGSVVMSGSVANVINELTFQYQYDNQNRLIEKKIPGSESQKFYYDNRDFIDTYTGWQYAESPL